MSCEHKKLYGRVIVTQKRTIELIDGIWETTDESNRGVDWSTSYMECVNCGKHIPYSDIIEMSKV